ncbi:hypothetical protein [Dysgonomonas capnocytophagoides]
MRMIVGLLAIYYIVGSLNDNDITTLSDTVCRANRLNSEQLSVNSYQ